MKLDISSLERALASLDRGIRRSQAAPGEEELRDDVYRAALDFYPEARALFEEVKKRNHG